LSGFSLLRNVPPEHVGTLVSMVRPIRFADGDTVARQGDKINEIIFILKGRIRVTARGREIGSMDPGQVIGLATIILEIPSLGDGIADGEVDGLSLSTTDFERLRELSPEFNQACLDLTEERLKALENEISSRHQVATGWIRHAVGSLRTGAELPSSDQLRRAREEHHGAPLAIWLGILLDGIPESFVIGSGLLVALAQFSSSDTVRFAQVVPYTLIAGLFLSNFPEALASSANMRLQGWGRGRIFMLWVSLMVVTAVGAGFGYLLAGSLSHTVLVLAEGLAAGAMLTMIAAAMIPEAVHQGDANAVGLSTLAGFLAAISFKLLE
jgi:CRP-like cAMP-binding protein